MEPRLYDWVALWNIYHPWFIWAYIGIGLPLRIVMTRRHTGVWLNRIWPVSGAVSALFVWPRYCVPLAAVPAFLLIFFVAGTRATQTLFMAFPMAVSIGAIGALIDAALLLVLRQAVNRKTFPMLFATNVSNVLLAIGAVLLMIRLHPIHVIAILSCCR